MKCTNYTSLEDAMTSLNNLYKPLVATAAFALVMAGAGREVQGAGVAIGIGDFGPNKVIQDYEGFGPSGSRSVIGGDTYSTDSGNFVRIHNFDPPATPAPIIGQSGFRVANFTDLGFIDIVLGTAVHRAGAFFASPGNVGGPGWTATAEFFDEVDALLGSVLTSGAAFTATFVGWETDTGLLIKRIRFTDTTINSSILTLDNLTTEIVPEPLTLALSFTDPVEDHLQLRPVRQLNPPAGVIDVVGLVFSFDNATGDYSILMTASPANPFVDGFRINVGLFNPDTGTTAEDPAFFIAQLNDFFLITPSTAITLTGSDPKLLAWKAGDRVAPCEGASFVELGPCQGGLGLPNNVLGFGSGVFSFASHPPFGLPTGTDVFFTSPPATIVPVPEPATLDIKPGSDPNSINCNNDHELIGVAILTTEDFDATTVDHTTVTFEGARPHDGHFKDVDGDGHTDLLLHFRLRDTNLTCESTQGTLTGETLDGIPFEGTDSVNMVGGTTVITVGQPIP